MLTQEQNDALTRSSAGTPGGTLLRSYWQPIALSKELPEGGAPVSVDVMGEELVLFRDDQGRLGLLDRHCCHRGTDLSFGRLEDGGLRCLYHGWLYDVTGCCLEQPAEPKNSTFKSKVRQRAYPVIERAGAFFAYMGEGEAPEFPNYDFLSYPEEHMHAAKVLVECNYLQANEGNYDPAHVGFLHRTFEADRKPGLKFGYLHRVGVSETDVAEIEPEETPRLETEVTEFGLRIFQIRSGGAGRKYVRVTIFGMPNFSVIAGPQGGDGHIGIWHVPIDDYAHWRWHFALRRDAPLDATSRVRRNPGEYESEFKLKRNAANRYLQDRSTMNETYTGMGNNFNSHDAFATGSQGAIQDRTREHLATTDVALAAARRLMLKGIDDVKAGKEPQGALRDANANDYRLLCSFDVLADEKIPNTDLVHIIAERAAVTAG
jgi:phenylpropionate dioxygenase-like ring-hydroxylating dioxygenase large terminal subunit